MPVHYGVPPPSRWTVRWRQLVYFFTTFKWTYDRPPKNDGKSPRVARETSGKLRLWRALAAFDGPKLFELYWSYPSRLTWFEIGIAKDDKDFGITLAIWGLPYVNMNVRVPKRLLQPVFRRTDHIGPDRVVALVYWSWEGVGLHWEFFKPQGEWHSSMSKLREGSFHPLNMLLGDLLFSYTLLEYRRGMWIELPEGMYPCELKLEDFVRRRKRWFVAERGRFLSVTLPSGIDSFPGSNFTVRADTFLTGIEEIERMILAHRGGALAEFPGAAYLAQHSGSWEPLRLVTNDQQAIDKVKWYADRGDQDGSAPAVALMSVH